MAIYRKDIRAKKLKNSSYCAGWIASWNEQEYVFVKTCHYRSERDWDGQEEKSPGLCS